MTARSEYEAAYFTLLRAREEHDTLLRYREYLEAERRRLEHFAATTRDDAERLPRKVRRTIDSSQRPLLEAVGRRRNLVLSELDQMDDRQEAAAAFVEECEQEVANATRRLMRPCRRRAGPPSRRATHRRWSRAPHPRAGRASRPTP